MSKLISKELKDLLASYVPKEIKREVRKGKKLKVTITFDNPMKYLYRWGNKCVFVVDEFDLIENNLLEFVHPKSKTP